MDIVISKAIELLALLLLLCTQTVGLQLQLRRVRDSCSGFCCIEEERDALLDFKSGLVDPGNRLSSWVKEDDDCCQWRGVRCNNRTGRVDRLLLRAPQDPIKMLRGEIRPSLLDLTHLKHLDLSLNNFSAMIGIPVFLGSFKELRYLNLSKAGFNGGVPPELGNLSTLQHLDLSSNFLEVEDTRWLSRLTSLRHLDMSLVSFQKASSSNNWLHALNMLPSILEIRLSFCELDLPSSPLPHHNNFTSLSILDLSSNIFNSTIPEWLCSLTSLSYLDLSWNQFYGHIPAALGNLTSLEYLDLSYNDYLDGEIPKTLANLCNLSTFSLYGSHGVSGFLDELQEVFTGCMSNNLETLDLSSTNLTGRMPDGLGGLRNLRILDMSTNQLYGSIPASLGNLMSLQSLDLSFNNLTSSVPASLGNLMSLQSLDVSGNKLTSSIPASLGNLMSLQSLDVSDNKLTSSIPASLGNLMSLQSLYLEGNKLSGSIPASLGNLMSLQSLYLGRNNLEGVLTEEHFMNLVKLKHIDISGNPSLALKVSSGWNPPFRLDDIFMGSCLLGPQFPAWLGTQENYTFLDMSNAEIYDTIPDWFWNLSTQFTYLNISHNKISGKLRSFTSVSYVVYLDLSDNLFSGPIPPSIWDAMPNLFFLDLSMNHINGTIPLSICKSTEQLFIDLSNNFLSGELPKCWENTSVLEIMDLSNNSLSGELPFALSNCTQLVHLDLSHNSFNGSIPPGIGQKLSYLKVLSLHSNMLSGTIPSHLSNLSALQILDLSHNQLSGFIPQSFGDFPAMKSNHTNSDIAIPWITNGRIVYNYEYSLMLNMKGRELRYDSRLLPIVVAIDLSDNSLSGTIPKEIGNLIGLESLNLSGNQLSGEIINEIGELRQLETLDLSKNKLSGRIPASLSDINFLSHLNLSYNNLTGKIPSGEQLQTLNDPSIYIGNDDLCGPPLINKCPGDETPPTPGDGFSTDEETEGSDDIVWIYSGMSPGFVVGLLAFFGLLTLKRKWRIAYFRFIDYIYDTIYVAIAININKLKRGMPKIGNHELARRN